MTTLLQINSSLFSSQGVSTRLADEFVSRWQSQHPDSSVIRRDLGNQPIPHLDGDRLTAIMTPADKRSAEQQAIADQADELIAELQAADVLVLGIPMYNFSIPSTLKSWFDHIARAGTTFRYTENGAEGLLKGKKAYIFTSRGGLYHGTPADTQTPLVSLFLGFVGIDDVEFVYAEGLNMGESQKQAGIDKAEHSIEQLLAA